VIWILYFITMIIVVGWSLFLYRTWEHPLYLGEDNILRFALMVAPSTFFLITLFSAYPRVNPLPLDIFGMIFQIVLIALLYITFLILTWRRGAKQYKNSYILITLLYMGLSLGVIILLYSVRFFPPLLIPFMYLWEEAQQIDLIQLLWARLSPQNDTLQTDFLINKALIAFISYVPITLVRMAYTAHTQKRLKNQINQLQQEMEILKGEWDSKK